MIKKTIIRSLLAVTAALAFAACSNSNKFHIEGNITEAKDSVLYFENMSLDGPQILDSVKLSESGDFSFSADGVQAPEFYRLRIAGGIINLSIDSTETVKVKASYPKMSVDYTVEGSDNCTKIKELAVMQNQLMGTVMAVSNNNMLSAREAKDSINAIIERYKDNVRMTYIFKEPQKAYAYFALFQSLGSRMIFNPQESDMDIRTFGAVATAWDAYYPDAIRGKNLHNIAIEGQKKLRRRLAYAQELADGTGGIKVSNIIDVPLADNKGQQRSLTEFMGKVVLLDFHVYATENSVERIMMLRALYERYHAQGLEIYQVSLDDNDHFWRTQTDALPWVCVRDPQGTQSQYLARYNVQSIPTFFLIDRTNALYKRDAQITDLDNEIQSLLR